MEIFSANLNEEAILVEYDYTEVDKILAALPDPYHSPNKNWYFNVPCSFDIETTSFFRHNITGEVISTRQWALLQKGKLSYNKEATMYIWQFGLAGRVFYGRDWWSWKLLMEHISEYLKLSSGRQLICWVHNLSFEFQWMRKFLRWDKVFATKPYEPLYALADCGICFMCSLRNSGLSLAKLGENLLKYKVKKMEGDLDYDLIRNSKTVLTPEELTYCFNDVKVVMAYIQEQIEIERYVHRIPLTKTGYVRRELKASCFKDKDKKKSMFKRYAYREIIKDLTLTEEVYYMLLDATQGGFAHGSPLYAGDLLKDVTSQDICSDYPGQMVGENGFPMSSFKKRDIKSMEQFRFYLSKYCSLFTIRIEGLRSKFDFEDYLARARCHVCEGAIIDNGRVHSADRIITTITEQDFYIMEQFYEWDHISISNFYTALRGYLPTSIVKTVLDLFQKKTTLKDVKGKEAEYMVSKGMLNSVFGCTITSIINNIIELGDDGWEVKAPESVSEEIEAYNNKNNRFLFWAWGCWVTAFGRRDICAAILHLKEDYLYTDTDSVKYLHPEKHEAWFKRFNEMKRKKIEKALKFHKLSPALAFPKTCEGEVKELGVFENEGTYFRFKYLGSKRYMYEYFDKKEQKVKIIITVAGLAKKEGAAYLQKEYKDPFVGFDRDLTVPALDTGKLTHTYIDHEMQGELVDYQGNKASYHEFSGVHLAPCPFSMSITSEYVEFVQNLKYRMYHTEWL